MASILTPIITQGWVRNYLEDLIFWAPDFPELLSWVKQLLTLLTDHGVKLNLNQCTIGLKEVTFLGHRKSAASSKPDPKNIEAVARMQAPTTVKEVRRFLGMCGFYRQQVPSFTKIATLLINLNRTNTTFKWTEQCQQSFEQLKACLMDTPILVIAQVNQSAVRPHHRR